MKFGIDVKDRSEGEAVARALSDPETRAAVMVMGALMTAPASSRARVIKHVQERLDAADRRIDDVVDDERS